MNDGVWERLIVYEYDEDNYYLIIWLYNINKRMDLFVCWSETSSMTL